MADTHLFSCGNFQLDISRPHIMGIVNVTPDSFSDGGKHNSVQQAVEHALKLIEEGADILDIGGESTRPGATPVSLQEELQRVIPVVEQLAPRAGVPISIDTYKSEVMQAAIDAGAAIVNDIYALQQPGALQAVANSRAGVCLMHMRGTPRTMQMDPQYEDVVVEVRNFLKFRMEAAMDAGISRQRIVLDPGFGFGKRTEHNLALLQALPSLAELEQPLLIGLSRKSVLGHLTGGNVDTRLHASIAASVISAMKGAKILRVHDVKATADALKIVTAVLPQENA